MQNCITPRNGMFRDPPVIGLTQSFYLVLRWNRLFLANVHILCPIILIMVCYSDLARTSGGRGTEILDICKRDKRRVKITFLHTLAPGTLAPDDPVALQF